jgi:hypothetical protein
MRTRCEMMDFDSDAPLNRIKSETQKAHNALMDYFLMGAGRSLRTLIERYRKWGFTADNGGTKSAPTVRFNTLAGWSTRFHWQARIAQQAANDNEIALEQFRQDHMSKEEVVKRLSDMGRADMADFADVRDPSDLKEIAKSPLIKKFIVTERRNKDGIETVKTTIELHDAQSALEKLARHHGLFKDRLDITTGDEPFSIEDFSRAEEELKKWEDERKHTDDSD